MCLYMFVCAHMHVLVHTSLYIICAKEPEKARKKRWIPCYCSYKGSCELPGGCWEQKPDHLQDQLSPLNPKAIHLSPLSFCLSLFPSLFSLSPLSALSLPPPMSMCENHPYAREPRCCCPGTGHLSTASKLLPYFIFKMDHILTWLIIQCPSQAHINIIYHSSSLFFKLIMFLSQCP